MGTWELPIALFTVLGQWAIGIAIMITIVEIIYPAVIDTAKNGSIRWGGMMVFPLIGVSLIASIFHLGHPFAAYRSILNLGTSMLSLEILAFLVVGAIALVYSYIWWKMPENNLRRIIGVILSIVGIVAIIISSKVYMLPARLAWNTWHTTGEFLLTAVFLGAISVGFLLAKDGEKTEGKAKKTVGATIILALTAIIIVLASFASSYGVSPEQCAAVVGTFTSGIFFFRVLFGFLLPIIVAVGLIIGGKSLLDKVVLLGLVGAVFGELAGRILFYSSVMSQYPWF